MTSKTDDVREGCVYVEVSGLTGTGKSAVMGEIEIALKALRLTVQHGPDFQAEKNATHADWQVDLDLYKPTVVLSERNISRSPAPAGVSGAMSASPVSLDDDTPCTDCGDTGVTHQTERHCACQTQPVAQDEGAAVTRLLKLADAALANVTAFEADARYIMGNTNYAITENARSEIRSFLLAQTAKTSVRPEALERALSILDRLLDHSGARGSFDAMKHGDAVKDAEELLRSARSPGHTDLMVTPESIDDYMKDNPMEAQDEGAAGEAVVQWFKPSERTPESGKKFVALHDDGSGAWLGFMHDGGIIDADGDDYSQTLKGVAYWAYLPTGFEFCCEGYPEDPITLPGHVCPPLNRAHPSPPPAAQDDRLRKAVEALEEALPAMEWAEAHVSGLTKYDDPQQVVNCLEKHEDARDAVRSALAALKSEAAK